MEKFDFKITTCHIQTRWLLLLEEIKKNEENLF
ncbi:MAG: hypothetical protein ACI9SD_001905 [Pseudohongiellaceae bacterium]|jgi:hypothetical protein